MNSFSIADELDQAVNNVLAGVGAAGLNTDLEIGELVGIASELRDLPEPTFRAQLKSQMSGHSVSKSATLVASQNEDRLCGAEACPGRVAFDFETLASRDKFRLHTASLQSQPEILPSLFRSTSEGYPLHQRNMAASLFMHVSALALVVVGGVWASHDQPVKKIFTTHTIALAEYPLPPSESVSHGGGGGGTRDKLKASAGAPPRFAAEQLTPPMVVVQNLHPSLPTESTVIGPPDVVFPKTQAGDLYSTLLVPSNGAGYGGGIGDNHGTGVGIGTGPGVGPGSGGGIGGGPYSLGTGVSAPRPIYDPEPEYSNEARVAKFQGDVVLWVVVGADGIPRDVRVQRLLGMGLDEKAIAAVRNWRFEPAMKDGHAVAVQVSIEVKFRLF